MKPDFRHRNSLKRTLLLILVPLLLLLAAGEIWMTWRTAVGASNAAYDRSLFGAVKAIDANISTASGGLGVELPYRMLELLQLTANGEVYYRIATEDELAVIGSSDLPRPRQTLVSGRPQFADEVYFGEPVRLVSYARALSPSIGGAEAGQRVLIQLAESVQSRNDFTRRLVLDAISRDILLIAVGVLLAAWLITWGLKPLQQLSNEVLRRSPDDLTPIDAVQAPRDMAPLVEAINQHVRRNRELVEQRRNFIDDASHQLRTPLATLSTQLAYVQREPDPVRVRDALVAIKSQLDETVRRTNQMLALGRADSTPLSLSPIDLNGLAESVTRGYWSEARERRIDLGLEVGDKPVMVRGHDDLLREALDSLLSNALKFTAVDGRVTVRVAAVGDQAELTVIDDGPGIPEEDRARVGDRFFRGSNVSVSGSGLGLAIAKSVAQRHLGGLLIDAGPNGRGSSIGIRLPLYLG